MENPDITLISIKQFKLGPQRPEDDCQHKTNLRQGQAVTKLCQLPGYLFSAHRKPTARRHGIQETYFDPVQFLDPLQNGT